MRISEISLAGRGAWPDFHLETIHPQLNVFFAPPRAGKSTLLHLAAHLLYGKANSPWRQQFGQTVPLAEGKLSLQSNDHQYALRRYLDNNRQERLTIASHDGASVDETTVRSLLADLSPEFAQRLFAVDFAETPQIDWLLSKDFGREFARLRSLANVQDASETVDRRRVDELIQRRDVIAREIEESLSVRRRESDVLERELREVEAELKAKRHLADQLQAQLRGVETELADLESRLRYYSLEAASRDHHTTIDLDRHRQQIEQLDAEIARCRQTLGELQVRETAVRAELAQLSPDGTADRVTNLADSRATLGVMEQLLVDLETEVAQIARGNQPGRRVTYDSHSRLAPVTEMLRQQVYALCGQLTEQERHAKRQQAAAEARQLTRAQANLAERLELLLGRRESLIESARAADRPAIHFPQSPVAEHCQCDRHDEFIDHSTAMQLGHPNRLHVHRDLETQRARLADRRQQLSDRVDAVLCEVDQVEIRWNKRQRERAGLVGGVSLEEKQHELRRLEALIDQSLRAVPNPTPPQESWRASDVLAQLTDGQLVQIRLQRHGRQATILDRDGRAHPLDSLTPAQHDAVFLALTLSLASACNARGVQLPLILDEPFLRQDAHGAAIMAGVLDEFARAGHQLFICTEDRHARRKFEILGSTIFDLETIRQRPTTVELPSPTETRTTTRFVRQTPDGVRATALQLAPHSDATDVFYLSESSLLDEFPVLGNETQQAFSQIDVFSVGELLAASTAEVARRLDRRDVREETVRLWQIHMGLMCYVPQLTLNDAQLLAASGVNSPAELANAGPAQLLGEIESFLAGRHGRRFTTVADRYQRTQVEEWITSASRSLPRWSRVKAKYSWWKSPIVQPEHQTFVEHQFLLDLDDEVEAAPSIGPKTADHLDKVGVRTVADLLHADPESVADELDLNHITAKRITAWQHQARLVCRIPELLGYGAQLLVACGYTEPEQIAATDPDELVDQLLEFCDTKKGQRILRNGDAPSRESVLHWIESAAYTRPLEAA